MSTKWKFVALVECPICGGAECIYTSDNEEQHTSLVTGETFLLSANSKTALAHREVNWDNAELIQW